MSSYLTNPCPDWDSHFVCACEQEQSSPRGPDSCPCVWALQSSPLVPVGFDTELSLQGKNLDIFEVMLIIPPHPLCLSQYVGLDVSWLCILKGHYSPVFRRVWVNSFMIMNGEGGWRWLVISVWLCDMPCDILNRMRKIMLASWSSKARSGACRPRWTAVKRQGHMCSSVPLVRWY